MVDLSGIRSPFLFAVVFFAIFALLISLGVQATPELFTGTAELNYYSMPEYFDAATVESLANYYNITANNGGAYYSEDWGIDEGFGHNFLMEISTVGGEFKTTNTHYFTWWVFPVGHHYFDWSVLETGEDFGESLTDTEFESVDTWDPDTFISSAKFKLTCEDLYMYATVAYNGTAYANATTAFANDALSIVYAINWDELGTGINAYNLIAQIMTFDRPEIHPALNSLIAIPLWALIGFIIVVIILAIVEALPFT